jgi:hypothetical protein
MPLNQIPLVPKFYGGRLVCLCASRSPFQQREENIHFYVQKTFGVYPQSTYFTVKYVLCGSTKRVRKLAYAAVWRIYPESAIFIFGS